jgi:hypothetical protein
MKTRREELNIRFHESVMDLSGEARVTIGCALFDLMRARILASMPKNLAEEDKKRQLFERIYGAPMEDFLSGAVTDADFEG